MKYVLLAMLIYSHATFAQPQVQDAFTLSSMSYGEDSVYYKVAIFPDGITVLITADASAVNRSFQIPNSEDTFQEVMDVLDWFQFENFEDRYGSVGYDDEEETHCEELWSHQKISFLSLQYAGLEKSVMYDHGCNGFPREDELKALISRVKNILGLSGYVRA